MFIVTCLKKMKAVPSSFFVPWIQANKIVDKEKN